MNNVFVPDIDAKGLAVLYSTGAGQLSWEDSALQQGVFSHYLVKALRGEGSRGSEWITIDGLFGYVRRSVTSHVFKKYNKEQIPYIAGERSGNFALALNDSGKKVQAVDGSASSGNETASDKGNRWTRPLIVLGVIAAAVLALSVSDDSDDSDNGSVTLVVPTP